MQSVIFNISEINKVNFFEVIQTPENLVYTLTCDEELKKTYVTWVSSTTPSFVSNMYTAEGPFNEEELRVITEGYEWLVFT